MILVGTEVKSEEDGATIEENSLIKARALLSFCKRLQYRISNSN